MHNSLLGQHDLFQAKINNISHCISQCHDEFYIHFIGYLLTYQYLEKIECYTWFEKEKKIAYNKNIISLLTKKKNY